MGFADKNKTPTGCPIGVCRCLSFLFHNHALNGCTAFAHDAHEVDAAVVEAQRALASRRVEAAYQRVI